VKAGHRQAEEGWTGEEGITPNGLPLSPEKYSGPDLPTEYTGRAWREASHLTHEGKGSQYGISA